MSQSVPHTVRSSENHFGGVTFPLFLPEKRADAVGMHICRLMMSWHICKVFCSVIAQSGHT